MNNKWLPLTVAVLTLLVSLPIGVLNHHGSKVRFQTYQASDLYLPIVIKPVVVGKGILFVTERDGNREIYVMDEHGSGQINLSNHPGPDIYPVWSPNGMQIAFSAARGLNNPFDIFLMAADGSGQTQITDSTNWEPDWSPDGELIAFSTYSFGAGRIYTMKPDGSEWVQVTNNLAADYLPNWSPDGSQIAFTHHQGFDNDEIYIIQADGTGQQQLTFNGNFSFNYSPKWSPDGTKIAFVSTIDGNREIYLMNPDGTVLSNLTNHPAEDQYPVWSPEGGRLAFSSNRDGDYEIYVMDLNNSNLTQLTNNTTKDYVGDWR